MAFLVLALYATGAACCFLWQMDVAKRDARLADETRDMLAVHARAVRLNSWVSDTYRRFITSLDGVAPGMNGERLVPAGENVEAELADVANWISKIADEGERTVLTRDLDRLRDPVRRLSEEVGKLRPEMLGDQTEMPAAEKVRLARLFEEAAESVSRLQSHAEYTAWVRGVRRPTVLMWYEDTGLTLGILFLALALGGSAYLYRQARLAEQEGRARVALIDQLRQAERKYRSLFDHASEGIFQITPEGRLLTANRALARMYGYLTPEQMLENLEDVGLQLWAPTDRREDFLKKLQQENLILNMEIELVRADGRSLWVRENVRAVRDDDGKLLYLEGTVIDVSDQWWSEQRRHLQSATSRVLDKAHSVAEARPMILKAICELLEWSMGAVWDVDEEAGVLCCVEVWHSPEVDIAEFEERVSRMTLMPGQGLAGQIWESGEPMCNPNLRQDQTSPGSVIAVKQGMGSVFGVPIKVQGEVRHVAEFYSPQVTVHNDPELLHLLGMIGTQLGHLIERKTAEEALRKSEMRKAAILHSAHDCIISFDYAGHILEFNPAAERTFDFRHTDALGRDIGELIQLPGGMEDGAEDRFAGGTGNKRGWGRRMELKATRSDGTEFPAEVTISRVKMGGKPIYTAFLRDISERKEAERLTSELAAVVANSNDAIIGCTRDGVIQSWNNGAERIYGYTAAEMIGRPLQVIYPAERQDELQEMLGSIDRGESLANYETVRLRKDGKRISVSLTDSPVRGEGGRITGLSSIARDITERKRLEEELLQSQKMEAIGRLAGGIAHDFNNVLTAILGYSDLLIGQIEDRHWMYKHLSEIRKAADFAASLTQQLLAFSRRQSLHLRVCNMNDVVRNMQKMLQRVIGERVKIATSLEATSGRLKADPSQLEQVLLNLCVNARDAMVGTGGVITISTSDVTYYADQSDPALKEMPAGEYVKLSVADTGTGIPADVIKHIFEPFFTTKEKGQGTGLGLATCYGVVKQSGGFIAVNSKVGVGTTFTIYLPRVDEMGEKAVARKEVGQLPGGSETVLYVEDELTVRSLTSHVMRRLGYTVLEAANGEQARAIVEGQEIAIDVLFADVVLPDVSGRELADWVVEQKPMIKLLFTSGYMDENILRRHGISPELAFLRKPFSPLDLARKLREVLDEVDFDEFGLEKLEDLGGMDSSGGA